MINGMNIFFLKRTPFFIGNWCVLFVLMVALMDIWVGSEISFSLFYSLPIFFGVWYGSTLIGVLLSLISAFVWIISTQITHLIYPNETVLYLNALIQLSYFLVITGLGVQLKKIFTQEESLADSDPLTSLANRRSFQEKAGFEMERCKRYKRPFTVAYIDLDNFKGINDMRGHEEGDKLLVIVSKEMITHLRPTDVCSRLGGDEFAVLLTDTHAQQARYALRNLRRHLLNTMKTNGWPVTFSIGAVTYNEPMTDIRDMLKLSDDLMYNVKKNGKNKIRHLSWPLPKKLSKGLLDIKINNLEKIATQEKSIT